MLPCIFSRLFDNSCLLPHDTARMRRYPLTLVTARSSALRSAFVAGLRRLPLLLPTSLLTPNVAKVPPPPSPEGCTAEVREPPSERRPKRGRSLSQEVAGMESPWGRKMGGGGVGTSSSLARGRCLAAHRAKESRRREVARGGGIHLCVSFVVHSWTSCLISLTGNRSNHSTATILSPSPLP